MIRRYNTVRPCMGLCGYLQACSDVFVSGFAGLVLRLSAVQPQRHNIHCSTRVLRSVALVPLVGASCFQIFFSVECSHIRFFQFFSENSVSRPHVNRIFELVQVLIQCLAFGVKYSMLDCQHSVAIGLLKYLVLFTRHR